MIRNNPESDTPPLNNVVPVTSEQKRQNAHFRNRIRRDPLAENDFATLCVNIRCTDQDLNERRSVKELHKDRRDISSYCEISLEESVKAICVPHARTFPSGLFFDDLPSKPECFARAQLRITQGGGELSQTG